MIYVDFYGGTHGNFLEFCINKFIFDKEELKNFSPFIESGTSHKKAAIQKEEVRAQHWSFKDHLSRGLLSVINKNDLIIRIRSSRKTIYSLVYNAHLRGGDVSIDLHTLEYDTLKKLNFEKFMPWKTSIITNFGERINYPRSVLRNNFYHQLIEDDCFLNIANTFKDFTDNVIEIDFFDFFDKSMLKLSLEKIANHINLRCNFDEFDSYWDQFTSKNIGPKSQGKVEKVFNNLCNKVAEDIEFHLLEEAYLNCLVTEKFGFTIDSDICIFDDIYPRNTKILIEQIT